MVAGGPLPVPRAAQRRRGLRPRVGDGLVRLDATGRVTYASPNALSAYRRLGLAGDLVGPTSATLTAISRRRGPGRRGGRRRGRAAVARAPRADGVEAARPTMLAAGDPAAARRPRTGALVLRARRHRRAPPRPRAGHQGRHDPRDPPPGEEQPADRGGAAAAAGPPDRLPRRRLGARGGGAPGRLDRDRPRDARQRRDEYVAFDDIADRLLRDGRRRRRARAARSGAADGALRRAARRGRRRRWPWRSPSCCRTPSSTASATASPGTIELVAERTATTSWSGSPTTAAACRRASTSTDSDELGLQIVRTLVDGELGGQLSMGPPAGRPGTGSCSRWPGGRACRAADRRRGRPGSPDRPRARSRPGSRSCRGARSGGAHPGTGLRRFSARRSSSESPPQTPESWPDSSAQSRHDSRDGAAPADGLGLLDLHECRAGRPDREEQLRVLVPARAVAPVHGWRIPHLYCERADQGHLRPALEALGARGHRVVNAFTSARPGSQLTGAETRPSDGLFRHRRPRASCGAHEPTPRVRGPVSYAGAVTDRAS